MKEVYQAMAYGINALLTRCTSFKFQQSCLVLLKRLHELCKPASIFEGPLLSVLESLAKLENP